jgi:hypothetical protein
MLGVSRSINKLVPLFTVLLFFGCDSRHATSGRSLEAAAKGSSAAGRVLAVRATTPAHATRAKLAPGDAAFSVYNNPAYGVSFRYPRIYALEEPEQEGDSLEDATLQTRERLAAEQPGSVLLATVTIPDDAYPRTTFRKATLQLAVNPEVPAEVCQWLGDPPDSGSDIDSGSSLVQGILFHWKESVSLEDGVTYTNRNYAGFRDGTCYEFFLEISSTTPDNDAITEADARKILRPLEKIIGSLELQRRSPPEARP